MEEILIAMIVEDDETVLMNIENALRGKNYEVITARNGQEAYLTLEERLQNYGHALVDIVVSDLVMPILDGLQLLRKMRQGPHKMIPFLLMSGALSMEELKKLISNDVDGVLYKPFAPMDLFKEIEEAIARRKKKETQSLAKAY